jgi:hypothetical protein
VRTYRAYCRRATVNSHASLLGCEAAHSAPGAERERERLGRQVHRDLDVQGTAGKKHEHQLALAFVQRCERLDIIHSPKSAAKLRFCDAAGHGASGFMKGSLRVPPLGSPTAADRRSRQAC